jgi:SNF2 family DNA or RNA helicase
MPEALRDYQIEDLAFLIANPKGGLLHDPGGGKTPPVCVYIEYLWKYQGIKTYWAMPKSLLRKNKEELLRFTNLTHSEIQIIDGTPKQRAIQMGNKNAKVFLMGFKRFADDWENLKKLHPELKAVIVDEVHLGFKTIDSQRTKALLKCMRGCTVFTPLSGTLIDGRLDSCYPCIHIIEPRYYANHFSFKAQHAIMDEYGTVLAWHNHAKIGFILQKHFRRKSFAEIYGKEEKVIQHELCEMHPTQREAYDEFEAAALLELDDKFLEGSNPAVAAMRCRQIMGHPHKFKLLKEEELTGKEEALLIHLEDHRNRKEPILIFASLQPEQERLAALCAKEGFKVGLINGNVSSERRSEIDMAFRAGTLDCVVASPATAGIGFNWGHINHVVFASLDYQNVNFVQAYRRAIRGKRTIPLRITVLEYADSIDQRIFTIINTKSGDLHKVDDSYEKLDLGHLDKFNFKCAECSFENMFLGKNIQVARELAREAGWWVNIKDKDGHVCPSCMDNK